jgi:hypothetical protein
MKMDIQIWHPNRWSVAHGSVPVRMQSTPYCEWTQTERQLPFGNYQPAENVAHAEQQGEQQGDGLPTKTPARHIASPPRAPAASACGGHSGCLYFGSLSPLWDPYIEAQLSEDWLLPVQHAEASGSDVSPLVRSYRSFGGKTP